MVNVVMVPLDGSEFGDEVIPMAAHVATDMHAEVELVHVVEALPPYLTQGAPVLDPGLDTALREERQRYLEQLAKRLRSRMPLEVTTTVLAGPVGDTLAGRSRLLMESVADKVVRSACVPVLLHRPRQEER